MQSMYALFKIDIVSGLKLFHKCQKGTTAIEYAMMAAGIALAVITAVELTGEEVRANFFDEIAKATK